MNVIADDKYFYILANKKDNVIGYYLIMMEIDRPERGDTIYLINWKNKTSIQQVDLNFLKDENDEGRMQNFFVVSYKAEGSNTYNVFVFDTETRLVRFWYETYQLYESPIKGFLLPAGDFLMLSKEGINVINLGSRLTKPVTDQMGNTRIMHSLGSCNYLRVESGDRKNHIHFKCQFYENRRVCIQDQYFKKALEDGDREETQFDDIYKIKIHEPTLRELLLI